MRTLLLQVNSKFCGTAAKDPDDPHLGSFLLLLVRSGAVWVQFMSLIKH